MAASTDKPLETSNALTRQLKLLSAGKLQQDIIWNLASVGIMGVSGILLNIIIGLFYKPAVLGVFNQVYAFYIFASQLAAVGLPPSALKYVAEYADDVRECRMIVLSALVMVSIAALIISVSLYFSSGFLGRLLDSPGVSTGLAMAAPGLFFFAVNKVLLAILNGFQRMKLFAILQSARYLLMLTALLVLALISWPGEQIAILFTVAESILFVLCLSFLLPFLVKLPLPPIGKWVPRHLDFGLKSFFSAMLLELNTRVDVLMLGYFATDRLVGIYSFAAMLAEGVFQLLAAVMRIVTPILVQKLGAENRRGLKEFITLGKRRTYQLMAPFAALLTLSFPLWIFLITNRPDFRQGWTVFSILVAGITAASGFIPFRNILQAGGLPGWHTIMTAVLVAINIVGNTILIPIWSINGAALATACAMVSLIFLLKTAARTKLGVAL